ncbi:MAG: hypothetical protein IIU44_07345 [Spirochaetales bacterium]|nr:hypothetical protein [Spirochaetales bacterium]
MKNFSHDGYRDTIQSGYNAVRHYDLQLSRGTGTYDEQLRRLKTEIATADAIVIGAGAGLSTSAGFTASPLTQKCSSEAKLEASSEVMVGTSLTKRRRRSAVSAAG